MASVAAVRSSNAAFTAPYRPVALFVGGTSGIGRGTAEAFARATQGNAHIILCGRNKAAGESIIASFPQTPNSKYEFVECDATLMKNVVATTDAIKSRVDTLNYLVLSQGILAFQGFTPTAEGIDTVAALAFYSRWKFVEGLVPLLVNAKQRGEEARVMTVLNSKIGTPLQRDNLGLKKHHFPAAIGQGPTYNNVMVQEYSKGYPQLSFTHIYPGWVDTPIGKGLPFWLRIPLAFLFNFFSISLEDCGEWMLYALLLPAYRQGGFFLDDHGQPVPSTKVLVAEGDGQVLFDHFVKETSAASRT